MKKETYIHYDFMGTIQIILIIGKLAGVPYIVDLTWWQIFMPLWFSLGVMFSVILFVVLWTLIKKK